MSADIERPALPGRRVFLAGGAALAAGGLTGREITGTVRGQMPWQAGDVRSPPLTAARFFTAAERRCIAAAVARLIPDDELGGGALEAGCDEFIDRQLSGAFGQAQDLYMLGPWPSGEESQGFQSRLTPAQTYRLAIAALEQYCTSAYAGQSFAQLSASQMDALLAALEQGHVALSGVDGKAFFELLLQNTLEGFWSDPLYGGNRDFIGWRLIGFPGARYDYREQLSRPGERYPLPPVGLDGRPDWSSRR